MKKQAFAITSAVAIAAITASGSIYAAVNADEAKQLGTTLTLFGAEKAGNKDGSIPEYTGDGLKQPASFDPGNGHRRSPYADEKPLFSITAQNAGLYSERLTDASKEMLKKYPSYRIDVYPSHRDVVYPKYVLDNTLKNATSCKTINNGVSVDGCYGGVPFPIPKTGNEVMWNHLLGFDIRSRSVNKNWLVTQSGSPIVMSGTDVIAQEFPIYDPKRTTPFSGKDVYWRFRYDTWTPARAVGEKLVLIDQVDATRRAYSYIPGQRRVKLAPDLAYDTPTPVSAGTSNLDDSKVFSGALDRYDFKLIGKKEKYIPANNYGAVVDPDLCGEEKLVSTKNFPNPDCIRWELHRVWMVEAKLKPQFRHIYKRRVFYWDEDAAQTGLAENYDGADKLYRVILGMSFPYYASEGGGALGSSTVNIDMQTGLWSNLFVLLDPKKTGLYTNIKSPPDTWYSPESLAGEGIR